MQTRLYCITLHYRESGDEDHALIEMKANFYAGGIIQLLMLWMKDPAKYPVDQINWLEFLQ